MNNTIVGMGEVLWDMLPEGKQIARDWRASVSNPGVKGILSQATFSFIS